MTELPAHLEFGNRDHIKAVQAWAKETLTKKILEEKKDWLIDTYWHFHDHDCGECGSTVAHDEDPEIEIVTILENEVELKLVCKGHDCDEIKKVILPLDF